MLSARFFRFFRHLNLKTIRKTVDRIGKQRLPGLAAEMAYNAMLALFPAILAILTAIGLFQPLKRAFQSLAYQVSTVAPEEALGLIQDFAENLSNSRNSGLFSLSFGFALWASSGAISAAMTALDQIHKIPSEKTRPFWKAKLISLILTIGTIVLLMLASTLVVLVELASQSQIANQHNLLRTALLSLLWFLTWPLALGIVSVAFACIYRFGPSQWSPGKPILPGAVIAAVSWAVMSGLFRMYVSSNFDNYNRAYGAVGAVIVLLLWLYLSSLVMLIGDELNVTVGEVIQQREQQRLEKQASESDDYPDPPQPSSNRLNAIQIRWPRRLPVDRDP